MKIRTGFVSNSSSCSFIVKTDNLYQSQITMILNHSKYAEELKKDDPESPWDDFYDEWNLKYEIEKDDCGAPLIKEIYCYTTMDNFDLISFLNFIGIPHENIVNYEHS